MPTTRIPPWQEALHGDPLPWLLEDSSPAVRHRTLRDLLDRPADDPELQQARRAAMSTTPIATILDAQHPDGYWSQPGPGYEPKYTGTVWQIIFLDQLAADGSDPRVRTACEYVLRHTQTSTGGFGMRGSSDRPPPPSSAYHCLTGNLLRALIGFGYLDDERVRRSVDWLARVITGEGVDRFYASTCGPLFQCGNNDRQPCAWGAIKSMGALARVPPERRGPLVRKSIDWGTRFLLDHDPAIADYPMGYGKTAPSGSWFRLGFPVGYVADVLQNLEVLCELGRGGDPRLHAAIDWVLSQQDPTGRWHNEHAYNGKTWTDIDRQGTASKWVTLRACRMLKLSVQHR